MALSSNYYPLKVQRLEKILRQKRGSKSSRMTKLWQFWQGRPKTRIFLKTAKGGPKEIFQKSPKKMPSLKRPKSTWRKWHYPLNCMHWKCKDWRRFWVKHRLQKCPNGEVIAIFARSPKTRIFWKSAKGGPREIFLKSAQKDALAEKAQKHCCANGIIV